MLNKEKILAHLTRKLPVIVYDSTDSTNTRAREYIQKNPCDRALFAANEQTAGRGRLGRRFYSPPDTGIYMTYVFAADDWDGAIVRVTTAASVAAAGVLEGGVRIKWVNDLYLRGRKIGGILTEAVSAAGGAPTHILVGIGINVTTADFPAELRDKAGAVGADMDREKTIAALCDRLSAMADDPASPAYLDAYRRSMMGIGQSVIYTENGTAHRAVIEGVDDLGGLIVRENGEKKILRSGEITFDRFAAAEGEQRNRKFVI